MKLVLVIPLILLAQLSIAQADSTKYYGDDTIIPQEEFPHYIGVNFTPLMTSIIGGNNKDIKLAATYKYNLGEKNLRTSVNFITQSSPQPFDYYKVNNTTDTSYDARFFSSDYRTFDIRFGFEELKGYRSSRLHIGADLILGYGEYSRDYYSRNYQLDSSKNYTLNNDIPVFDEGFAKGGYVDIGLDISFGFDWFMSEHVLFTFQLTPQFNYFILTDSNVNDPLDNLPAPINFPEFKIGLFDVFLIYKL